MKKEAVGTNSWEKEDAGTWGSFVKKSCGKFWGKRGFGNKRFPVKKEAVGNSEERKA